MKLDITQGQSATTTTTQANRSPQLDQGISDLVAKLNGISSGLASSATGVQNTYTDVINSLRGQGSRMAGLQGGQASTAGLASGFTPFEAAGAGRSAYNDIMMQLFPQVNQQRLAQAQVPYQLQKDLSQYAVNPFQQLLTQVMAPYEQGVAGQTQTATTTNPLLYQQFLEARRENDIREMLGRLGIQTDASTAQARMAQDAQTAQMQNALEQAKLAQGQGQADAMTAYYNALAAAQQPQNDNNYDAYMQALLGGQGSGNQGAGQGSSDFNYPVTGQDWLNYQGFGLDSDEYDMTLEQMFGLYD
jgi:hypothetical protein